MPHILRSRTRTTTTRRSTTTASGLLLLLLRIISPLVSFWLAATTTSTTHPIINIMVLFNLTVGNVARQAGVASAFNPRPALKRLQPLLTRQASTATATSSTIELDTPKPVPMTLLSGFLGTGKTTTLKHLLENTDGLKIGVVVNDVAAVNIDAKLVANESKGDMVELQNGCACCSIADELFTSVEKLCKNRKLDAVVVELSGVADPKAIQNNWKMAPAGVRKIADIAKVVTVVDAQTFGTDFMTWDMAQNRDGWVNPNDPCAGNQKVSELLAEQVEAADVILVNKADLATPDQVQVATKVASALNEKALLQTVTFGNITPMQLIGMEVLPEEEEQVACTDPHCQDPTHNHKQATAGAPCADPHCTDATHDHSHVVPCAADCDHESHKAVGVECSDPHCHDATHDHSKVVPCPPDCEHESHQKAAAAGVECTDPHCHDTTHDHSKVVPCASDCDHESHKKSAAGVECADPHCTDASHDHSKVVPCAADCEHESHKKTAGVECADPHCTDASHDHSKVVPCAADCDHESHKKMAATECADPHCTDASHDHSKVVPCASDCDHESHQHSHNHAAACNDPHCTDPSHNYEHAASCNDPHCDDPSHSHSHSHATSTDALGISNFVYKSDRPFHSQRLLMLLNRWPVPKKDILDMDFIKDVKSPGSVDVFGNSLDDNPFLGVLRSKGFTWLAPSQWSGIMEDAWRHDTAMYLSHAGRHMSIDSAGKWWATIPREQMDKFFEDDLAVEKERILKEDFVSEEFGDRRQELVFIGMDIDKAAITSALDECLLSDEEMESYRQQLNNHQQMLFTQAATSVGLMDTMGTQHIDQSQ